MSKVDIIYNYYEKCVYFWFMYTDAEIDKADFAYKEMKNESK